MTPGGNFNEEASKLQMMVIDKHHLVEKLNEDQMDLIQELLVIAMIFMNERIL